MTQAFYRKWRPHKWDEVVAQEHVIQTLRNSVRTGHTAHAYLFAGPRGTGKTTTARLLAKALNCLAEDPGQRPCDACQHCKAINEGRFLDLIEIDAASNTSVDDVRDLREKINFSPTQGQYKVYIIDEVHMLSTAAFNALLKTLEEPPPHAIFVLATTEVHKIPATILSRVQRYEFRRIPVGEIVGHLRRMAAEEKIAVDEDALFLIARQATGAMRDAISLLDQLSSTGNRVTLKEAQIVLGTATSSMVIDLVNAVLAGDAGAGMQVVTAALDAGTDPRQFARQVVDYLRNLMLVKMGNADQVDAPQEQRHEMAAAAGRFDLPRLLEAIRVFNAAAVDSRSAWHPGLALELAVAECVAWQGQPVAAAPVQPAPKPAVVQVQPAAEAAASSVVPTGREPSQRQAATAGAASPAQKPAPEASSAKAEPPQADPADRKPSARAAQPVPAEQAPAESAPASPGDPSRGITHDEVQASWNRIRAMVKKRNSLTEALLNSCRYSLKDSNTLVLSFQAEVVKSKMETEENIKLLRETLHAIFGTRINVKCVLSAGKSAQPSDLDVEGDGIVGTALDLGGKIVYEE